MRISVTGHRPNKLYGYNIFSREWMSLKEEFKKLLVDNHCTEAITGMALGVDTVFALAVLELQDEGYNIKLHCAIPCRNHSCKWNGESVEPVSRRRIARIFVTNAAAPAAFVNTTP